MNYLLAIKQKYPGIKDTEFSLADDGKGVYIKDWTYTGADKPLVKDLKASAKTLEDKGTKFFECVNYLRNTDWYVVRNNEEGTKIPDAIKKNRKKCREILKGIDSSVFQKEPELNIK